MSVPADWIPARSFTPDRLSVIRSVTVTFCAPLVVFTDDALKLPEVTSGAVASLMFWPKAAVAPVNRHTIAESARILTRIKAP